MSITDIASILFNNGHSIKNGDVKIIPNLVLREQHRDSLGITSHPIQSGAAITDHAYVMPPQFTLEWGWSNASLKALTSNFSNFKLTDSLTGQLGENYIKEVYHSLLKLQQSRVLCTVVTSKRRYKNVLIESINGETTEVSSYALPLTMNCRSVQIVETATGKVSTPNKVQKFAAKTSSELKMGTKPLQKVEHESFLYKLNKLI